MVKCTEVDNNFSIAAQPELHELEAIKDHGFVTVICNRPDFEDPTQPLVADIEKRAIELGLEFVHIPCSLNGPSMQAVELTKQALGNANGPVLGYCKSGKRALLLWALSSATDGSSQVDDILNKASSAGFDLEGMRPTLEGLCGQ